MMIPVGDFRKGRKCRLNIVFLHIKDVTKITLVLILKKKFLIFARFRNLYFRSRKIYSIIATDLNILEWPCCAATYWTLLHSNSWLFIIPGLKILSHLVHLNCMTFSLFSFSFVAMYPEIQSRGLPTRVISNQALTQLSCVFTSKNSKFLFLHHHRNTFPLLLGLAAWILALCFIPRSYFVK